ncbi:hypothetical protein [Vibrio proteolyticus]
MIEQKIKPAKIQRDKNGYWTHPGVPNFGESATVARLSDWGRSVGIIVYFLPMAEDPLVNDSYVEQWFKNHSSECLDWNPQPESLPFERDGTFLLSIHESEDGPTSWWAVPFIREDGFYRVKQRITDDPKDDSWTIMHWNEDYWTSNGCEWPTYQDNELIEIDESRILEDPAEVKKIKRRAYKLPKIPENL